MKYYKYLSPERIDVIRNLKIRYTQVTALNDPFESLLGIIEKDKEWYLNKFKEKVVKEIQDRGIKGDSKKKQFFRARKKDFPNWYKCYTDEKWLIETSEEIQNMVGSVSGILSLSATEKNILMWSHYSSNHEGFVIEFNGDHEYFCNSIEKIIYSDVRPYYDPTKMSHEPEIFNTKSLDWKYEQEFRKSMPLVEQIELENGNKLSPFDKKHLENIAKDKIFLFDFPKEAITSVILGWKSSSKLKEEIIIALNEHELNDVVIRRAVPHKRKFEMEVI
jgi:hypothetical protein